MFDMAASRRTLPILCFTLMIVTNHATEQSKDVHQPQYTFSYNVNDPFTGDSKSQIETRQGDVVQGQYSLDDPDGTRRTVDYKADSVNGFNAVVNKSPIVRQVALVHPKVSISSQSRTDYSSSPAVAPSYVSMPYSVAQLLLLRAHVPENWYLTVLPHFYY